MIEQSGIDQKAWMAWAESSGGVGEQLRPTTVELDYLYNRVTPPTLGFLWLIKSWDGSEKMHGSVTYRSHSLCKQSALDLLSIFYESWFFGFVGIKDRVLRRQGSRRLRYVKV